MKLSAGLLPFRRTPHLELLIAHPGGPLWARKDAGAWSVIKGEVGSEEDHLEAALREFAEETGWDPPSGPYHPLGDVTQRSGKRVEVWAVSADFDPAALAPGTFTMRWRGKTAEFPEIDRVVWCGPEEAKRLLNPAQAVFVGRVESLLEAL